MNTNRVKRGHALIICIVVLCIAVLAVDSVAAEYWEENFAIHALSTDADALQIDGPTELVVKNASVFSNGGVVKNGSTNSISLTGGSIMIAMDNGWSCPGCDAGVLTPAPQYTDSNGQDLVPWTVPGIPEPYCPLADERDEFYGVNYYVHQGIAGSMYLQPGIHCVYGDISLNADDALIGEDVMIIMKNGGMKLAGNSIVNLDSGMWSDKNGTSYAGMLIYLPKTNTSAIQLGSKEGTILSGTIFAPEATCELGGSGNTFGLNASIICSKVRLGGASSIQIVH